MKHDAIDRGSILLLKKQRQQDYGFSSGLCLALAKVGRPGYKVPKVRAIYVAADGTSRFGVFLASDFAAIQGRADEHRIANETAKAQYV